MGAPNLYTAHLATKQQHENSLLHVQTILCLLENNRLLGVNDRIADLLATMGGKTVHKNSMRCGGRNQIFIYLIRLKYFRPLIGFVLTAHARPGVRVNRVRSCNGFIRVAAKFDRGTGLPRNSTCVGHNLGVGLVPTRSSDPDM